MSQIIPAAWMLAQFLKFTGVAIVFCGVALFGWHFIGANGRAARDQVGSSDVMVWGGIGAKRGFKIFVLGILVHLSGFFLGMLLSGMAR